MIQQQLIAVGSFHDGLKYKTCMAVWEVKSLLCQVNLIAQAGDTFVLGSLGCLQY